MMSVDFIIDFESGLATEKQVIENFADGIKDGSVWQLQGFYGRTARDLIEAGLVSEDGEVLCEFDGDEIVEIA